MKNVIFVLIEQLLTTGKPDDQLIQQAVAIWLRNEFWAC